MLSFKSKKVVLLFPKRKLISVKISLEFFNVLFFFLYPFKIVANNLFASRRAEGNPFGDAGGNQRCVRNNKMWHTFRVSKTKTFDLRTICERKKNISFFVVLLFWPQANNKKISS